MQSTPSQSADIVIAHFRERGHSPRSTYSDFFVSPVSISNARDNCIFFTMTAPSFKDYIQLKDCIILGPECAVSIDETRLIYVPCADPRAEFFDLLSRIFLPSEPRLFIHPSAQIDPNAEIAEEVRIGANVIIGPGCSVGRRTEIRSGVCLFRDIRIGEDCLIKSGAVIGQEGFGLYKSDRGTNSLIPHIGGVVIGNRVLIGALNTVCAGTLDPTVVGDDTKTDDHVHIAHNCIIGRNVVITACAELSGSVVIGDNVWIGPQACVMNKVTIAHGALIGLGAVVTKDVSASSVVAGNPARALKARS